MSTNISKQKRDDLVAKIKAIRTYIASAPQDENTGALLTYLSELEKEVKSKKYGLVFEEHQESIDEKLATHTPVLVEENELFINNGGQLHFLIEGDNLAALQLLLKTHREKIDLIYIDPPYNTEEKDFMYDDNYVDKNDTFRHSKWLSFISKRLQICKLLLSQNGFIFISIDDNEASQLKILCDSIFGEGNYQKTDYIQVRYPEKTLKSDMKYHKEIEQVLVYRRSFNAKPYIRPEVYDYEKFVFSIEESSNGISMELGGKKVVVFQEGEYKIVKHKAGFKEGLKEIWATGTILNGNSSGRFFRDFLAGRKDTDGLGVLYKVLGIGDDQYDYRYFTGPKKSNATKGKYYQGVPVEKLTAGSMKISPIPNFYDMAADFGNIRHEGRVAFNGGKKPVKLIRKFIDYFERDDITILDFFAGSGSTGHAVIAANHDGGTRQFILVTNNQNGICRNITYTRLQNTIDDFGKRDSLKYYRVDFVPISKKVYYEYADELLLHVRELVELENGVNFTGNAGIAIVLTDHEMESFMANINKGTVCKRLYRGHDVLLTAEQTEVLQNHNITVCVIPDYYYRDLEGGQ
ncbi:MAG: site-specific DNA-methyltransferase [Christensenellaceae bacterium]